MKSNTRSILSLSLAVSCLCAMPLSAQSGGAGGKDSIRIDFISWGEDIHGLEVRDGKRSIPVKALAFRYSEPFEYSGPPILALSLGRGGEMASMKKAEELEELLRIMKEEGIDDPESLIAHDAPPKDASVTEGEIPKALAAAREEMPGLAALVKLPANSRRVTILLAPGPDRSLVPHVWNDDPSRQPPGMIRVHNFSPHPIMMTTNSGESKELAPGKNFVSRAPGSTFAYELSYKIDGKWKIQENNLVAVRPADQVHMVILRSGSSFFSSSDGSRGGFMQTALLRRNKR